jgi:rare lipoprotein A
MTRAQAAASAGLVALVAASAEASARPVDEFRRTCGGVAAAAEASIASWYGWSHQGRRTASGERFDRDKLTAAHPTLPLGTLLRVSNLRNGRSVVVRVNDRGPVTPGRALDLSEAAARALQASHAGLACVAYAPVENGPILGLDRGRD